MSDLAQFRRCVSDRLGLAFEESKVTMLREVLLARLAATALPVERYLARIDDDLAALSELLTVNETYFFRNREQFRALVEEVIPARIVARPAASSLRILSAGCSSGEEAYSIAMVVADALPAPTLPVDIVGVDVAPAMIEKARAARYSRWSLRDTSAEQQKRWFTSVGNEFVLAERIRQRVRFEQGNLALDAPTLLLPGMYDVIFCRNMLMYFSPKQQLVAVERLRLALAPGGFLFLGHAETMRHASPHLAVCHTHETFYYRHEPSPQLPPRSTLVVDGRRARPSVGIGDSATREPVAATAPARTETPVWDLASPLALLAQERYLDALGLVHALPASARLDPEVTTLEAVLLTHAGDLAAARDACNRLLRSDSTSAGAHYLLALCCEAEKNLTNAIECDRTALQLQPTFAMAGLHLGLVARRMGDHATARHALRRAVELLMREDGARLALFGGGFGREALVRMCRRELESVAR